MTDKDKTLEQIFGDFNPDLSNGDAFMASLDRKLDAVEFIKARQEKQHRQYRYAVMAAFVLGIIVSGVMFALILAEPATSPIFSFGIQPLPFILIEENNRMLSFIGLAMTMSAGIVVVINMWQELASTYDQNKNDNVRKTILP